MSFIGIEAASMNFPRATQGAVKWVILLVFPQVQVTVISGRMGNHVSIQDALRTFYDDTCHGATY